MQRRFLTDYDGGTYTGPLYRVAGPARYKALRGASVALAAVLVGLYVGMGLAGAEATRDIRAGVPYALLLLSLSLLVSGVCRFAAAPPVLHRRHYEGAFLPLAAHGAFALLLSLAALAGGWRAAPPGEGLFTVLAGAFALTAAGFLYVWGLIKKCINLEEATDHAL